MLTFQQLTELQIRARAGWNADGRVQCTSSEIGELLSEVVESRDRTNIPILTKIELETVVDLQKAARIVHYNNTYSSADRILFIDTIEQAQRIIYAAALKRMKPGASYQLIEDPKEEEPVAGQVEPNRAMSIAEMKRKNEARVTPARGDQECQSTPSTSVPGSTTPVSPSANPSQPPKPKFEDSEISQSSE